ncbi:histone deacetylase domain-containing protein [Tribonema minus]|uniref:Histone deacetylase domain-containing protein n=1 Tax=Tribonema minus TaxID=303371 RepID=A0A836CER0_9STRA|nr:histone deacetylase domain-containing protein [Tribonema minus]
MRFSRVSLGKRGQDSGRGSDEFGAAAGGAIASVPWLLGESSGRPRSTVSFSPSVIIEPLPKQPASHRQATPYGIRKLKLEQQTGAVTPPAPPQQEEPEQQQCSAAAELELLVPAAEQTQTSSQTLQQSPITLRAFEDHQPLTVPPVAPAYVVREVLAAFAPEGAAAAAAAAVAAAARTAEVEATIAAALEPVKPTLLLYVPDCLEHVAWATREHHQECPARMDALCGPAGALHGPAFAALQWGDGAAARPATMSDLLRVHEYDYIALLQAKCEEAAKFEQRSATDAGKAADPAALGGTRGVDRGAAGGAEWGSPPGYLDADTLITAKSFAVARKAAGAVIEAVDRVMSGANKNAFVVVRPPGHHAGPSGSVPGPNFWRNPDMNSSGFCLVNNVAVGAAYAMARYGRGGQGASGGRFRVAIVDFDIHQGNGTEDIHGNGTEDIHGNGTEDIVRSLRPRRRRLPLPPSWPPAFAATYKPWLDEDDAENVMFASINLVQGHDFYPASGHASAGGGDGDGDELHGGHIINAALAPVGGVAPGDLPPRARLAQVHNTSQQPQTNSAINVALSPVGGVAPGDLPARARLAPARAAKLRALASLQLRASCEEALLPRLAAFAPDVLFVSAGFDGHHEDMYHWNTNDDYAWLTRRLMECAAAGGGRVVSVLEGGYSLAPRDPPPAPQPRQRSTARVRGKAEPQPPAAAAPEPPVPSFEGGGGLAQGVRAHVAALMGRV